MTSPESIALIRRAKAGDREAWGELCNRYYPHWLKAFHGELGQALRKLHDTADLVQSAIADALRDVRDLRCDAAFYCWVSAIVRRKIAEKRRQSDRGPTVGLDEVREPGERDAQLDSALVSEDEYLRLLDTILDLFRSYPEPMAAIYLKYFEKTEIPQLMEVFGKSERGTYRLVETALALLREKLGERIDRCQGTSQG